MNNSLKFLGSSLSPQPSPVKGEGGFLTFYGIIEFVAGDSGRREDAAKLFGLNTPNAHGRKREIIFRLLKQQLGFFNNLVAELQKGGIGVLAGAGKGNFMGGFLPTGQLP